MTSQCRFLPHSQPATRSLYRPVRYESLADIRVRIGDVCFTPKSGHAQRRYKCPLSAMSGRADETWYGAGALDRCGISLSATEVESAFFKAEPIENFRSSESSRGNWVR